MQSVVQPSQEECGEITAAIILHNAVRATDIDIELLADSRTLRVGSERIDLGCRVAGESALKCCFDPSTKQLVIKVQQPESQDELQEAEPVVPINPESPGLNFCCEVRDTKSVKGRGVFAKGHIPIGTRIFQGQPMVSVLHERNTGRLCAGCFAELTDERVSCSGCLSTHYCSAECQRSMAVSHQDECQMLRGLSNEPAGQALRGMRLFTILLLGHERDPAEFDLRVASLLAGSHFHQLQASDRERYKMIAKGVFRHLTHKLGDESPTSIKWLTELICATHTNLHGIAGLDGKLLGSGLYPEACFFNHSCSPNCIIAFDGNRMEIHTIADIGPDEEIHTAYTELYALKADRQKQLKKTKRFECQCTRCISGQDSNLDKWMFEHEVLEWKRESDSKRWALLIQTARESLQKNNIQECLSTLRTVLIQATPQLHPNHVVLFDARCLLVSVLVDHPDTAEFDSELAVHAGACAKAAEDEMSRYHPIVPFMLSLKAKALGQRTVEGAKAFGEAAERLAIAYGSSHPTVQELIAMSKS